MAAGDMRVCDSNSYHVSVAGIPISGYADGEWLTVERDSPAFEDVVGTDGEVTRSKTNDNRATVTIRLMQSSPVNGLLSVLHNLDKNTPNGAGVGPFLLTDIPTGTTLLVAEKCWISEEPNGSWDRTPKEREWKIRCANLLSTYGGN